MFVVSVDEFIVVGVWGIGRVSGGRKEGKKGWSLNYLSEGWVWFGI